VTPVHTAIASVGRALNSFHPLSMPRLARGHYRRESVAWACLSLGVAAVESGVTGVIARNVFDGVVDEPTLNFAVAILAGATAFGNIASFFWAGLSQGRHKIRFLVGLQAATMILVALVAAASASAWGLLLLTMATVCARLCWSGVVTLRSTVWRANYPRQVRARMSGKITTIQALLIALSSFIIGWSVSVSPVAWRPLYLVVAAAGLVGTFVYRGMRMRGHKALLAAENSGEGAGAFRLSPLHSLRILAEDRKFRGYMICMFLFGTGNLMVTAPLVIVLKTQFQLDPFASILITSSIPFLLMPFSIPFWSKLLDRVHIIEFRAVHGWSFVASIAAVLLGSVLGLTWLLWVSAVLQGIAFGGGVLGWNLGHLDFAPPEKASLYMGVHVTLTGIRGLFAPLLAVGVYQGLEEWREGTGGWVFAVCLVLSVAGALGFMRMRRALTGPGHDSQFTEGPPVQSSGAG